MLYALIIISGLLLSLCLVIYINPGPEVKQTDRTAWLKNIPIAHRGLHTDDAEVPENSIKAFRAAVAKGYAIELDVLRSADDQVVVFHDINLSRMAGLDQDVADLTWEQIKELRLLGTNEPIPSLKDVLELVQGKVPLLIEIKNGGPVGRLEAAIIEELKDYSGDFAVQSFNPFVLQYMKENAPDYIRGQLAASFKGEKLALWKKFLLRFLLLNKSSSPFFVAYETGALPQWFARRLRQKGLYLLSWTVRDMEVYKRDLKIYDNVIFEGFHAPKANDLTP